MSEPTWQKHDANLRDLVARIEMARGMTPDGRPTGYSLLSALPFSLRTLALDADYLGGLYSPEPSSGEPK